MAGAGQGGGAVEKTGVATGARVGKPGGDGATAAIAVGGPLEPLLELQARATARTVRAATMRVALFR